jgi:uncharacterized hydrophobic protein (TIGR00271 family)
MNWISHFLGVQEDLEDFSKIRNEIEQGIHFRGSNLLILIIAIFVAAIGLNVNSTAVIIGAMLISPLMGPIMGVGLGAAINDFYFLSRSVRNYLFATIAGLLASTIYFYFSPLDEAHSELLARTTPNIYDLLIALFGGAAGIIAVSSKNRGNVVPGVAIATALMPPLCTAGYGIASLQPGFVFGALYLYLINTVYISLATYLFAKYFQFPKNNFSNPKDSIRSNRIILFLTLFTLLPSLYLGYDMVIKNRYVRNINQFLQAEINSKELFVLSKNVDVTKRTITLNYIGKKVDSIESKRLHDRLRYYGIENTQIYFDEKLKNLSQAKSSSSNDDLTRNLVELMKANSFSDSFYNANLSSKLVRDELRILISAIEDVYFQEFSDSTPSLLIKILPDEDVEQRDKDLIQRWAYYRLAKDTIRITFAK